MLRYGVTNALSDIVADASTVVVPNFLISTRMSDDLDEMFPDGAEADIPHDTTEDNGSQDPVALPYGATPNDRVALHSYAAPFAFGCKLFHSPEIGETVAPIFVSDPPPGSR